MSSPFAMNLKAKDNHSANEEGIRKPLMGKLLFRLYAKSPKTIRFCLRSLILKLEGGPLYSQTIRQIFSSYHQVSVGMYSGYGCFIPFNYRDGTTIGRYCTIYGTAQAFSANHPMNLKSSHALFFNPELGFVHKELIERGSLTIGNDVFLGHNSVILPSVRNIGDGAIIGAGAVIHQDVPPYAVMAGNPARVVRYRFSPDIIQSLLDEKWWDKSTAQLRGELDGFTKPLDGAEAIR